MTTRLAKQEKPERRQYRSVLRADQMERTRELLLETAARMLSTGGAEALSIRAVAEEAQVSAPTAYRYFPSQDALLDALAKWINDRIGFMAYPESLEAAAPFVAELYRGFDREEMLIRAQINSPAGSELRRRGQRERAGTIRGIIDRSCPALDDESRRRLTALTHLLISAGTWQTLRDRSGLTGAEAGELCGWTIRVVARELLRNPRSMEDLSVTKHPHAKGK